MKLLSTLFIAIVALCNVALAQSPYTAGIKTGLNLSTVSVDNDVSYGTSLGYQFGGFISYKPSKVGLQVDVIYSRQGAKIEADGEDLEMNSTYVNVPITVRYDIFSSVNLQLGPQVGFLNCVKSDYHPVAGIPFQEQHYTKAYKKTDFGITVGAGWESAKIVVDVRYYLGLSDISDYEGVAATKNRVLQFTFGYKIFQF